MANAHMDISTAAFLRVLDETCKWLTNMCTAWSTERECDSELLEALMPHSVNRNFNSAMYWMSIRLGTVLTVTVPQFEFRRAHLLRFLPCI